MKTTISLPEPLFAAAEEYARGKGLSRSQLYAQALQFFLHTHQYAGVTESLDRVYAGESSQLDPALAAAQAAAIKKETW